MTTESHPIPEDQPIPGTDVPAEGTPAPGTEATNTTDQTVTSTPGVPPAGDQAAATGSAAADEGQGAQ